MASSGHRIEPRADVIVVGLGAMGSAVAFRLAERGLSVVGIDRFRPPHRHGSTHGETRITRLAIGEGAEYVPLVARSHELWREIERDTATSLLHQTGGLVIGHRDGGFLEDTRAAASVYGISHENLTNAELKRRFPMFDADGRAEAYFEPQAGYLRPEAAVSAQLSLARRAGAEFRLGETIISWTAGDAGAAVSTATSTLEARELVLCPGAWITQLLPEARGLFATYAQVIHWFPIRHGYEALRTMPIFVWETGGEQDEFAHLGCFYGFPAIDGANGGVKLGTETYEMTIDPDELQQVGLSQAATAFYQRHLSRRFPWVEPEPLRSTPCLYTNTRGSRFIIDRHPAHANVTIVSACSGHGFKHSPAIGEAVAQMIVDGASQLDLTPFRMRPAGDR